MTESEIPNNPAARLHSILLKGKAKGPSAAFRVVCAEIFQLDSQDIASVLRVVSDMVFLVRDAKKAVVALEDIDNSLFVAPFDKIERALNQVNVQGNWGAFYDQLDEGTMTGLAFCADTLRVRCPEPVPQQVALDELLALVDETIAAVIKSTAPQQLKSVILEHLEAIKRAIKRFDIWGTKGLTNALESSVGAVLVERDVFSSERNHSTVKNFFEVLGRVNLVVTLTEKADVLISTTIKALLT